MSHLTEKPALWRSPSRLTEMRLLRQQKLPMEMSPQNIQQVSLYSAEILPHAFEALLIGTTIADQRTILLIFPILFGSNLKKEIIHEKKDK